MFEHFTFGALAQTRHHHHDEVSASPTDTSFVTSQPPRTEYPFPDITSHPAINDIVSKFGNYTLRPEDNEATRPSICPDTQSSPTFDEPFTAEELSYVSTRRGMTTVLNTSTSVPNTSYPSPRSSRDPTPPCRRLQRQLNTQMQSSTNHIKDINSLVENMIFSNSQCVLHTSTSRRALRSPSPGSRHLVDTSIEDLLVDDTSMDEDEQPHTPREVDPNEDEGFAEMEDDEPGFSLEEELSLRRASMPSGIRKYGGAGIVRWRTSGDCVPKSYLPLERHKIHCMPRMRKRKKCRTINE